MCRAFGKVVTQHEKRRNAKRWADRQGVLRSGPEKDVKGPQNKGAKKKKRSGRTGRCCAQGRPVGNWEGLSKTGHGFIL